MRNRRSPARRTRVDQEVAGPPVVEEDQYIPPRRPPLPEIWPWLLLLLLLVIGGLLAAYFLTRDDDNKELRLGGHRSGGRRAQAEQRPQATGRARARPAIGHRAEQVPGWNRLRAGSGSGHESQSGLAREGVGLVGSADIGAERRRLEDIRRGRAPESRRLAISGDDGGGYGCAGCGRQTDPGGGDESRKGLDRCAERLQGRGHRAGCARPAGVGRQGGAANGRPRAGRVQGAERSAKGNGDCPEAAAE